MDLGQALRTTGAVRSFTDDPVDDATLAEILEVARFAPSGGNRQPWRVVSLRDPEVRRRLAALMQPVWDEYVAARAAGVAPFNPIDHRTPDVIEHAPNPMLDELAGAPAVLVVAADLRSLAVMDGDLDRASIVGGGSIYPFCWSILLAAHERGLGGVMTTFLARREPEAAELLGLPEHHAIAAMLVLGRPEGQRPTRLRRRPVHEFTTVDRFDGPPLGRPDDHV